jgi:hypothetical protein
VFEPLLASVKRRHGIFHQLFHPYHTVRPDVAEAFRMVVRRAKEEGLEWWTARRINDWERARRSVRVAQYQQESDGIAISLQSERDLIDATVLSLDNGGDFTAWGFAFTADVRSIESHKPTAFHFASPGRQVK